MAKWHYTKGLHDIGNGLYAYLQPDGGWGWSNAGLIVDGRETLLVDTLFDLKLTREMLQAMRATVPASASIGTLVNTHANGDHTFGNQLVEGATIVTSRRTAEEMAGLPPEGLAQLFANWKSFGEGGEFLHESMGSKFDFSGIVATRPGKTFDGELSLKVGNKEVRLIEVGPAHTKGDTIVHVPADRIVFTGDILFHGGHPVLWAGPIANWINACDLMLGLDVETIVPGHGPIADKQAVRNFRDYLVYIRDQARRRFDAGLSFEDAANDIALDGWRHWSDSERIVVNVATLYREFRGEHAEPELPELVRLFGLMGRYKKAHSQNHAGHDHAGHSHD